MLFLNSNFNKFLLSLAVIIFLLPSCKQDNTISSIDEELRLSLLEKTPSGEGLDFFIMPESHEFSKIPQDPRNPITNYKVALGKLLFHETGLMINPKNPTGKETGSCASCHHADGGFAAAIAQGLGEGGSGYGMAGEGRVPDPTYPSANIDVQPLKTPSAMNAAWQEVTLWNGQFGATGLNQGTEGNWTVGTPKENNNFGYHGVETQAIAGMGVHRLGINAAWIAANPTYKYLFDLAFQDVDENVRYTIETGGLAVAAYERTLLANQSPWQKWLKGNASALTEQQKEGALLFFGKGNCGSCHTGPALNSMAFYCIGMNDLTTGTYGAINVNPADGAHKGRGGFTGNDNELYQFKVPQLYNLKDVHFYGHGSSITSIRDMVHYKNEAIPENAALPVSRMAPEFHPLGLTASEIDALTDFLENALYDPNLKRYEPDHLPSGNCFPNNDVQSRIDRGCN